MQHIEQLTLVFMYTFYLHIEQGIDREINTTITLYQLRQARLVLSLYHTPTITKFLIINEGHQLLQLIQVGNPLLPNYRIDQIL